MPHDELRERMFLVWVQGFSYIDELEMSLARSAFYSGLAAALASREAAPVQGEPDSGVSGGSLNGPSRLGASRETDTGSESYPGQAYFHEHNKNIKRAEQNAAPAAGKIDVERARLLEIGHCPWDTQEDEESELPEPHCHANRDGDCDWPYCPQPLLAAERQRGFEQAKEMAPRLMEEQVRGIENVRAQVGSIDERHEPVTAVVINLNVLRALLASRALETPVPAAPAAPVQGEPIPVNTPMCDKKYRWDLAPLSEAIHRLKGAVDALEAAEKEGT